MLQRIITALVLLPLMLGMLFYAPAGLWAFFCALIALIGLWEYSRLSKMEYSTKMPYLAGTALFMLFAYLGGWQLPDAAWWLVLGFWLAVMPLWLKNKWPLATGWHTLAAGWMLMLPFWFALTGLRPDTASSLPLLAVMGLVWVADSAAYFVGRSFGKHKIAPSVSPGKSWEGAAGGMVCAVIYMLLVRNAGWLGFETTWPGAVGIALILTVVSICGDLLESWLKRTAGVKDSSGLLPGHGGVFDRTDSLLAVLGVYAAIYFIFIAA